MALETMLEYQEKFNSKMFNYLILETKQYLKQNKLLGLESFYEIMFEWEKVEDLNQYKHCATKILELIISTPIDFEKKEELLDIYKQTVNEILLQLKV